MKLCEKPVLKINMSPLQPAVFSVSHSFTYLQSFTFASCRTENNARWVALTNPPHLQPMSSTSTYLARILKIINIHLHGLCGLYS
jgi:hypothetical protein